MNTWGYLILITALLVLAALMLYARIATRSREKSLHHAPMELMFPLETISKAPFATRETATHVLPVSESLSGPAVTLDPLHRAGGKAKEEKPHVKSSESEYFDELQEAAAGLAMLMRSSPVGRIDPVVFAPEEKYDSEDQESVESLAEAANDFIEIEFPAVEVHVLEEAIGVPSIEPDETNVTGILPGGEASIDETVETVGTAVIEPEVVLEATVVADATERALSPKEILGDQVSDQIGQIDQGLDVLESLVRSIESSLRSLTELDIHDDDDIEEMQGDHVSEAA